MNFSEVYFYGCSAVHMQAMNDLKKRLSEIGVNCTERRFRSDEGIDGITTELFVSLYIYVLHVLSCNDTCVSVSVFSPLS